MQHQTQNCLWRDSVDVRPGFDEARPLSHFCSANGPADEDSVRADLVLTHETIAQGIGCSPETVCRTLNEFKRKRVAELVGTTLLVHDRTALECLSAS